MYQKYEKVQNEHGILKNFVCVLTRCKLCFFIAVQKIEAFEHRMYTHALHKDVKLEEYYGQYEKKAKVISTFMPGRWDSL